MSVLILEEIASALVTRPILNLRSFVVCLQMNRVKFTSLIPTFVSPANPHYLFEPQLTFAKKELLDELFDESGAVRAIEAVGDTMPGSGLIVSIARAWHVYGINV